MRHLAPIYGGRTPLAPLPRDGLVIDPAPDILVTGPRPHLRGRPVPRGPAPERLDMAGRDRVPEDAQHHPRPGPGGRRRPPRPEPLHGSTSPRATSPREGSPRDPVADRTGRGGRPDAPRVDDVSRRSEVGRSDGRAGVVERKLAACAQRLPIRSTYWWKGQVERSEEVLVLFKTLPKQVGALFRRLRAVHPYEVPEIVELERDAGRRAVPRLPLRDRRGRRPHPIGSTSAPSSVRDRREPGKFVPSRNSSAAPPPVEMNWNASATPRSSAIRAESPPAQTWKPGTVSSPARTSRVPAAKRASSARPRGPFQKTVRESRAVRRSGRGSGVRCPARRARRDRRRGRDRFLLPGAVVEEVLGEEELGAPALGRRADRTDLLLETRLRRGRAEIGAVGREEREGQRAADQDRCRPGRRGSRKSGSLSATLAPRGARRTGSAGDRAARRAPGPPARRAAPHTTGAARWTPTVEAWARWTVPNASSTKSSPSLGEGGGEGRVVRLLPGVEPQVLEQSELPVPERLDRARALGPVISVRPAGPAGRGSPRAAPRSAPGTVGGSALPFGRPRWESTIVRAPLLPGIGGSGALRGDPSVVGDLPLIVLGDIERPPGRGPAFPGPPRR